MKSPSLICFANVHAVLSDLGHDICNIFISDRCLRSCCKCRSGMSTLSLEIEQVSLAFHRSQTAISVNEFHNKKMDICTILSNQLRFAPNGSHSSPSLIEDSCSGEMTRARRRSDSTHRYPTRVFRTLSPISTRRSAYGPNRSSSCGFLDMAMTRAKSSVVASLADAGSVASVAIIAQVMEMARMTVFIHGWDEPNAEMSCTV